MIDKKNAVSKENITGNKTGVKFYLILNSYIIICKFENELLVVESNWVRDSYIIVITVIK